MQVNPKILTNMTKTLTSLLSLALFVGGVARADFDPAAQLLLGNPSGAVHDTRFENNYLISRNEYALAYSRYDGIARWVSWHLNASDVGGASRGSYKTDTTLPAGWYRVDPDSGWSTENAPYGPYDRGHMCPSGDRTANDTVNDNVFWMTNLIPQAPTNNQVPWNNLEGYCRTLVDGGNELYIVCGTRGFAKGTRITSGNVTIPAYVWKIIVVIPDQAGDDIARINASTRVIAVDLPNTNSASNDWKPYRTSIATIEANTGLHFLTNVPVAVRNALLNKVDAIP
jgi:endonuclease G, mitochondrial